jgi:hypothetical protein
MHCREKCSFSKHGGNSIDDWATKRTLFRGEAADLAARARATTSRCDGKSNGGGEEGDGHVQPRVRGVRERGFASPEKATNILTWIHVALPRIFRRQIAFQQVLRRAHDARPDSAAVTVRLPRDDLARYVRVPHPARPHASRARGAARSTGHWLERVCFKSRTKSKRIFFVRPQFAFPRPERTRPRAPSPWVIRRFSRAR